LVEIILPVNQKAGYIVFKIFSFMRLRHKEGYCHILRAKKNHPFASSRGMVFRCFLGRFQKILSGRRKNAI